MNKLILQAILILQYSNIYTVEKLKKELNSNNSDGDTAINLGINKKLFNILTVRKNKKSYNIIVLSPKGQLLLETMDNLVKII